MSEYWVVNLVDRQVDVFRAPVDGRYSAESVARTGEVLRPSSFPDVTVSVDAILRARGVLQSLARSNAPA